MEKEKNGSEIHISWAVIYTSLKTKRYITTLAPMLFQALGVVLAFKDV